MRFVFLFLLLLIVGGLIGAVVAPNYIDWNTHKPALEKHLAQLMGTPPIKLHGNVDFKLLPTPEFKISGLTITPYTGEQNIAEIEHLTAEFSWKSIASLKLHANSINADALTVTLVKVDENTANYLPERRSRRVTVPRSLYPLSGVDNLIINKLTVSYEDTQQKTKKTVIIPNLKITGSNLAHTAITANGTLNEEQFSATGQFNLTSLRQIEAETALKLSSNTLSFKGTVFDPFHQPMFKGALTANLSSFADVFAKLSTVIPTALVRYQTLENIAFTGDVMLNDGNFTVENAALTLPDGTIEGRISAKQKGPNGRPFYDVALTTKAFDLDHFLKVTKSSQPEAEHKTAWPDTPFDLSFFEGNDFKFSFKANTLKAHGNTFDALSMMLNNENKTLLIEEGLISMEQGSIRLNGQFQYNNMPNFQTNIRLNKMPLKAFFTTETMIAGGMSGTVDLQTKGSDLQAMMNTLNGKGDLKITEGTLIKTDLEDMATALRQIFKKQTSKYDTPFSDMTLTFEVENGTLRNDDFLLISEKAAVKAKGKIDLARKTINLTVTPQTKVGVGDILVPVKVSGALDNPSILPVVTSSAGKGAAIGALLGGPIGAAAGAMIGSTLSKNNKKPDAPEPEAPESAPSAPLAPEETGEALPFDLKKASPEDIRQYFEAAE